MKKKIAKQQLCIEKKKRERTISIIIFNFSFKICQTRKDMKEYEFSM